MGQIAGELKNRPQGSLPSMTEAPRGNEKEQCQVVTLRSGKVLPTEMHTQRNQDNLQPSTSLPIIQQLSSQSCVSTSNSHHSSNSQPHSQNNTYTNTKRREKATQGGPAIVDKNPINDIT